MSRLNVEDEALYARYRQGELDSDLDICLKAASSEEGVKVSKVTLNELSALLGDMAHAAIQSGNNALTIEELSHEQLKCLAAAMYGKSLKDMFSLSDVPALSRFAHKYNIPMEKTIQNFVPARFEKSQAEAMLQLYSSVPGELVDLQENILRRILLNYDKVEKAEERLATIILPRHLNLLLSLLQHQPNKMLAVVTHIIQKVCVAQTQCDWLLNTTSTCVFAGTAVGNYDGRRFEDTDQD